MSIEEEDVDDDEVVKLMRGLFFARSSSVLLGGSLSGSLSLSLSFEGRGVGSLRISFGFSSFTFTL